MVLAIHPGDSAFVSGRMLMPTQGTSAIADIAIWSDNLLNSSLLIAFVILALINLANLIDIVPSLLDCLWRWKGNLNIDASLKLANPRNKVAAVMLLPVSLLASRYDLFQLEFCQSLSPAMQTLVAMGVVVLYVLVRRILFNLSTLRCRRMETALAAHHSSHNYFIIASLMLFIALGVCMFLSVDETTTRMVIYATGGLIYFIALVRKLQIFNSFCGPIQTILYLCALEILPTGAIIAASVLL